MKLSDLGEFGLVERFGRLLPPVSSRIRIGIGDDAAVILPTPGRDLILTTDAVVEGIHFDRRYTPADAVGWKALAVSLSDLAAMAAEPVAAVVAIGIPPAWDLDWIEGVYQGLRRCAEAYACPVVGGDTVRSPTGFLSLAVLGDHPDSPVTRAGARSGDLLCVTGSLGGARVGLTVLSENGDPVRYAEAVTRFLRPLPRIAESRRLVDVLAPTAMIDISDGLSSEIVHLCEASGVGCRIDSRRLPIHPDAARWAMEAGVDPLDLALGSGEEYELLFTFPPDRQSGLDRLAEEGLALSLIGEIREREAGKVCITPEGERPLVPEGWDHFRS